VDLSILIERIVVSPEFPKWAIDLFKKRWTLPASTFESNLHHCLSNRVLRILARDRTAPPRNSKAGPSSAKHVARERGEMVNLVTPL